MSPPNHDHRKLTAEEWNRFNERADEFAVAASRGPIGEWERFLEGAEGALRNALLQEMVRTDMELRWSQGRRVFVEDYVRKYPELLVAGQVPLDLIVEEWQQRCKRQDHPEKITYLKRFPRHAADLERRLRVIDSPASFSLAAPAESAATDQHSNYTFLELLGRGQSGEVWHARRVDGQEVAIKMLHEAPDRDEARREVESLRLMTGLRHECILPIHGYWTEQGRLYIVMELAKGSLGKVFNRYRHMQLPGIPRGELLDYFRDAAAGLDYLHEQGICHRDIKPDNLLLSGERLKLADFGLARLQPLPTHGASLVGTPAYMAPEAWSGRYTIASDQYSLAMAFVELRTGHRAIEGTKFVDVMMGHLHKPPRLDGLLPVEQQSLGRALSKRPEARYQNCQSFLAALAGQSLD